MKDEKITTAKTGEEWEKRQKQQEEQKQEQAENEREGKEQGQAEKQSREEKQPIVRPPVKRRKRKKKGKGLLIVCVLLLAAGLAGFAWYRNRQTTVASADVQAVQTASVTRMDITSELTASSSLAPKDTYEVTSLVEGEILAADFEEGDIVEKGQVLYRIDASSMDRNLSTAQTSLQRARENLTTAQEDYQEAAAKLPGGVYPSSGTGYIKTLYITEGDKVTNGTKLTDLYDDSVMKLTVPFLSGEADNIPVGSEAVITLEDTGEQLSGNVTVVSSREEALSGGRLVKAVTVETANPGGLTTLTQATVTVGEFVCSEVGTFVPKTEISLSADLSGNGSLEVESLMISEGGYVTVGSGIFKATGKSAEKYLKNFEESISSAQDNLESAEHNLSNMQDDIDDYTVTAPISGTVITKNSKVGDKITRSSSGSASAMAVIYDLSTMTLEMSVDELDVGSVRTGQSVEITADAVGGETFTGVVTNVSLQSSYSNGVTNYPVTVTLDETGSLLPGMNVDARIILESSEKTLCIPAGALMRGNRVYVKEGSPSLQDNGESGNVLDEGDFKSRRGDRDNTAEQAQEGMAEPAGQSKENQGQPGGEAEAGSQSGEDQAQPVAGSVPEASRQPGGGRPDSDGQDREMRGQPGADGAPEGFVAVHVEAGIMNENYVEILSGLMEGDEVYIDPNAGKQTTGMWQMGPGGMGGGSQGGFGGPQGGPGGMGGRP